MLVWMHLHCSGADAFARSVHLRVALALAFLLSSLHLFPSLAPFHTPLSLHRLTAFPSVYVFCSCPAVCPGLCVLELQLVKYVLDHALVFLKVFQKWQD